jgi:hypothetical protein
MLWILILFQASPPHANLHEVIWGCTRNGRIADSVGLVATRFDTGSFAIHSWKWVSKGIVKMFLMSCWI